MSYTRGNDLSGSMEGAGLPRQSEASAGGIGGLLARSAGYSCSDSTLTVSITNESSIDCIFWIYSDAGTNVDGEVVSAGSDRTFTFSAVGGVQYTVWGTDNRFHELGIVNTWTATLDHHALDLGSEDPDPEDATATDFGSVLCADSDIWPRHDYYFVDGNGNIVTLIDTNQAVSASYRYDPFGNITSQSGAMADANVYRFSSKEFHPASGLYYYGYRFYDPNLQRWINRDPVIENGFIVINSHGRTALRLQLSWGAQKPEYVFVGNNPNAYIDPLGLDVTPNGKVTLDASCTKTIYAINDDDPKHPWQWVPLPGSGVTVSVDGIAWWGADGKAYGWKIPNINNCKIHCDSQGYPAGKPDCSPFFAPKKCRPWTPGGGPPDSLPNLTKPSPSPYE